MCYSHFLAMACALGAAATADTGSEPISIPLKEIWALEMPGTRDIRELDPPREREPQSVDEFIRTSLVEHTSYSLGPRFWPKKGQGAGRGFIVVGSDLDALREAHAVLAEKKERADYLPAGKALTLVFYSYASGRYVHLDDVTRSGQTITVKYHLVAHRTLNYSTHLALIPLGELPVGKMRVLMEEVPDRGPDTGFPRVDPGTLHRTICDSFSFGVVENSE